MLILGLHDGHNSGATLLSDGVIVASISEERLTRNKNEIGYPRRSIDDVLRLAGCAPADLDAIVYASNFMHSEAHLRNATEWYRVGPEEQRIESSRAPEYLRAIFDIRRRERIEQVIEQLGGTSERISFVDHHLAHAAAAYFGSPFPFDEPTLILTADGAGDGMCATVSIGRGAEIERLAGTKREASLGKIYSRVTFLLGLTPWEHEYKVMGLAPYAEPKRSAAISKLFRNIVVVAEDGLTFRTPGAIQASFSYHYLREHLERARFDEISGGVQMYTEEMLCEWVQQCVDKTGIRRLACGGGVFMNVKANMRIAELDCVDDLFVFPSCGDESLSFGAVWLEYYRRQCERGGSQQQVEKRFLSDICLGASYSQNEIQSAIDADVPGTGCTVERFDDVEEQIAARLADNRVVARFAGRMEWGARALGNRSILANPREWRNVEKINAMIKMRDFWMPFAPSMLAEAQGRYLRNPKNIISPFMMLAYGTTRQAEADLGAAIHPRDKTARAQFVEKERSPEYWSVLKSFEGRTGQSAVLNTSFNLHGYPLVNTPGDAIDVFLRSGLDCLALENHLITKPAPAGPDA